MEELGPLWSHPHSMDELKQMILCNTTELESEKTKAFEETRKNKENLKHLLCLLKTAYQERDEARNQLQKLLRNITPSPCPSGLHWSFLVPLRANPATGRTHHASESNGYHLQHRSSASHFPLGMTPPSDFLNADMSGSSNDPCNVSCTPGFLNSGGADTVNRASDVIDDLVVGKALPEKGKFLQAVMKAGPLLQTLIWSGTLPRWRNPPPLKPFSIPPVNITGYDPLSSLQAQISDSRNVIRRFTSPSPNLEAPPEAAPGTWSRSKPNFIASYSGSTQGNNQILSAGVSIATNSQVHTGYKRRKIQ
ncbi:hypothetical protein BT93_J1367 [Corymbia citriodora subsp. variegata]|nr:hypothetical protein BT93_J1367 [Corymbia citriodora subsp. variegata]